MDDLIQSRSSFDGTLPVRTGIVSNRRSAIVSNRRSA
jgi:hypothetical protein